MEKLKQIIDGGESITVEFKQSKGKLNKDVFETVCAFLNRNGGHLFLGVRDDGEIIGIKDEEIEKIKKEIEENINKKYKIFEENTIKENEELKETIKAMEEKYPELKGVNNGGIE